MRFVKLAFKPETFVPMVALIFASGVCVTLVVARMLWTLNVHYAFLVWNLFLAWLPLGFAILLRELQEKGEERSWRVFALGAAWLLFFPNAPYIFTDIVHLTSRFQRHFWVDMTLILSCALTGLVLGFVSLYLMHAVIRRKFGGLVSWLFIAIVAGLSGIGVYIGRFLRMNSWDVFFRPARLYQFIGNCFDEPAANGRGLVVAALFATFLFIAYVMLYALTHLPQSGQLAQGNTKLGPP